MTGFEPGDPEYRAFVGPFDQYDVMGATQFALLFALGLRQTHRLLDIGCGSLRAGRLFIAYLDPGNYVGIEPNQWLIEEAIKNQIGRDIITIKMPTFRATESFDVSGLGSFDFVVAQSVASHAGPPLIPSLLGAVSRALAPSGMAAITFIHAVPTDTTVVHARPSDLEAPRWLYPGCYSYERAAVETWLADAGLAGCPVPWYHPRQTWWLLARHAATLPSAAFVQHLSGASLAEGFERSWNPTPVDDSHRNP